jgi:hypothetical protein
LALAMRIISSVSAALLLSCTGTGPRRGAVSGPAPSDRVPSVNSAAAPAQATSSQLDASPRFNELVTPGGRKLRIPAVADEYVRLDTGVDVQVLAEMDASVIVVDTYLSRPGGGSYCQAGQERFLRILRLDEDVAQATLSVKLASCWQEIELSDPGVEWSAVDSTLHIQWLFGPTNKMQPEELTLRLLQR